MSITLLRWTGRTVLVALILFFGLIVYRLVRESIARSKYRADYPPPGQMVSLDTHDIHLHCVGIGNPTVVFEADLDQLGSSSWSLVQSKVEQYEALKISTRDAGEAEVSLGHWQDEIRWRHLDAQVVEIEAEARRNRDGTWE